MGISGLLPLLKSIQVNRHLSEFAGQTLAIDAYGWLHRGVYTCAGDIAAGKQTTRYVDYAMHRVRLLRHHRIQPFVVFDGGPLPAKKGTDTERKRRRDENLARGNTLAAQGKHSQAHEFYVKCVDVTPQMAFQLIKALRAEGVPYVVAPYEADAQLAYLERIGLVSGIITEDSDLLVFGCKKVLFKLDAVSSTVSCISRSDFGSITTNDSGISLLGWSDVQFRAMAIMSGCDYLPSIAGVGLKTAWSLLRKHKTVENALRAMRLDSKKDVPRTYLQSFKLAEKAFLHQRVYDPVAEKLVNMTPIPNGELWNEDTEAYVGIDLDPPLAKSIAVGDADPVTLLPMEDINPAFVPRRVKTLSFVSQEKGKVPDKPTDRSILNFFAAKPKDSVPVRSSSQPSKGKMVVGQASGKRTLVEVMDLDVAVKRKRSKGSIPGSPVQSRFFGAPSTPKKLDHPPGEKENIPIPASDDSDVSLQVALEFEDHTDPVTQEDGYLTPSSDCERWETPEVSSPIQAKSIQAAEGDLQDDDFGVDPISSPVMSKKTRSLSPVDFPTPARETRQSCLEHGETISGNTNALPVVRSVFGDDITSEIDIFGGEFADGGDGPRSHVPRCAALSDNHQYPRHPTESLDLNMNLDRGLESVTVDAVDINKHLRNEVIAKGWREKWALHAKLADQPSLRRHETTVDGHHKTHRQSSRPYRGSHAERSQSRTATNSRTNVHRNNGLTFLKETHGALKDAEEGCRYTINGTCLTSESANGLARFRYKVNG